MAEMMVRSEVERAPEDEVVVRKQVCLIGHSFIHRLREHWSGLHVVGYLAGGGFGLCPGLLSGHRCNPCNRQ